MYGGQLVETFNDLLTDVRPEAAVLVFRVRLLRPTYCVRVCVQACVRACGRAGVWLLPATHCFAIAACIKPT